jgi:sigma-E factor negative regulatory protein RseC
MIEQQARVINIEGDQLVLEAETHSSCSACDVKNGCGTSVLAKWVGRKFTRFNAKNTVDARVGDQVIVGLSEKALMSGSLAVYLWPLLGMIAFSLASDMMLLQDDDYRDQIIAVSAGFGFVLSLLLCRKILANDDYREHLTPVVLRRLPEKLPRKSSGIGHDRGIGHGRIAS